MHTSSCFVTEHCLMLITLQLQALDVCGNLTGGEKDFCFYPRRNSWTVWSNSWVWLWRKLKQI